MTSMKEELAKNIVIYRKRKGLTQEELAKKLGLSFQAVSKWETAQTMPDISLLPNLSLLLDISVDKLLGYSSRQKQISIYEEEYKISEYYWGITPSKMCLKVLDLLPPNRHIKLLDIGCGEGKDAVFFARNGYDVTAFDISDVGIEKAKRLANSVDVNINFFKADILDFRLDTYFDIIFSSGVLHYIHPELRNEIFNNYKQFTNANGLNVFNVFVKKPFIPQAPERETSSFKWISGELFTHYHDWNIQECSEVIFDCNSSGIPHKHAMNILFAQKQ